MRGGGAVKLRNPVPEILTTLAALWSRISSAIGSDYAECVRYLGETMTTAEAIVKCVELLSGAAMGLGGLYFIWKAAQ